MSQLRVGLIGCGSIALSAHVPALAKLTSLAELVTVCDIREAVAEQTAQRLGTRWTTDYHQLLADPALDAVIITTPEVLHAEQTLAAAQAGKHVLCEKPIAASLAEADAMLAAAASAGIHFMVAHSRRFTQRYQQVRALLDQGAIGAPVLIRENERRPRAQYAVLNLPVDIWQPEPGEARHWKDLARYSGGVARGHAIHELDLFRWFAGSEGELVRAEAKVVQEDREVPDTLAITVRFANGVVGGCDLYTQAPTGYPSYHELELIGTDGVLRARDTQMLTLSRFTQPGMQFPTAYGMLLHVDDAYVTEQKLFFESILADRPVPLDPREGRAALELALAVTRSAEIGEPVRLPLIEAETGKETTWTA